ncbi:hypothetical protein G4H71_00410 [Rhodococcus triatomae]|uniref:Uncharacterized protein n=1 Tax=Rhodococcus triatomae TaxID=300028 RepID=A0A1G8CP83_9NOCA|nr:hypothetical protein [Rhodococcus triatomae]QNG18603.1 hypothetical protein G4H72_07640 [Rhodococcus triatomae]QNG21728.1 hypothetical protein G4H71_00410 [Rhodococcus triatomae]SDH47278.1 hypothetical protein SAMN05444695_10282 [Rhodococcus triatomae]
MAKWTNVVEERDGEYRLLAAMDPPHAKLFAKVWTGAARPLERIETGVHWEYPEHRVAVIAGYHETVNRCRGWDAPVASIFSVFDRPLLLAQLLTEDDAWYDVVEDRKKFERADAAGLRALGVQLR